MSIWVKVGVGVDLDMNISYKDGGFGDERA
jgi:hypothetical protein